MVNNPTELVERRLFKQEISLEKYTGDFLSNWHCEFHFHFTSLFPTPRSGNNTQNMKPFKKPKNIKPYSKIR